MTRTPLTGALTLVVLLGSTLVAGCGGAPSAREDSERQRQRPRDQATATVDPAAGASTKPGRESGDGAQRHQGRSIAAPAPAGPRGNALTIEETPDAHLIGARALGTGWSTEATGGEAGRMTSDCQRATLHDIGAMDTRVRDFAADGSTAAQAVSRFGDAKSAWRAEQVMIAWREDCAEELDRRDAALGTVRHGSWLSVVEIAGLAQPRKQLRTALAAVEATF